MFDLALPFLGTVSDGEFCSLRTQGETTALHVWQLIRDAKESVKRMSKPALLEMLVFTHCKRFATMYIYVVVSIYL